MVSVSILRKRKWSERRSLHWCHGHSSITDGSASGAEWLSRVRLFATPLDCSPLSASVHGILQARILEWVAISFSRGIFPTQGANLHLLCLLHRRRMLYPLSHRGSPSQMGRKVVFLSVLIMPPSFGNRDVNVQHNCVTLRLVLLQSLGSVHQ